MGSVADVGDANYLSISRLSQLTGISRETIARKIAGVKPAGNRAGHPVYALRDVGPALWGETFSSAVTNPDDLPPKDRKDWYDSELKRLQYEQDLTKLLKAEEVRAAWASALKAIMLTLDTLVDVVERDAGLTPEQASIIQRVIDRQREALYLQLAGDGDDGAGDG